MDHAIIVKAAWDPEAGVWYVCESSLPGLAAEADTVELLMEKLPGMILDLIEECDGEDGGRERDVPIELIAHVKSSIRVARAA
jgi:hypothetical protein